LPEEDNCESLTSDGWALLFFIVTRTIKDTPGLRPATHADPIRVPAYFVCLLLGSHTSLAFFSEGPKAPPHPPQSKAKTNEEYPLETSKQWVGRVVSLAVLRMNFANAQHT
jgi:hypothetical protein